MRVISQFHLIIQHPENKILSNYMSCQVCPPGMSWMCLWLGNKQTANAKVSRSRSHSGDGANVESGGPLNALVFRRFYHGSESGVFVCQQGSRAVKFQDLPRGEEQNVFWHQLKHPVLISPTAVHDTEMRTCCVFWECCNLSYFP